MIQRFNWVINRKSFTLPHFHIGIYLDSMLWNDLHEGYEFKFKESWKYRHLGKIRTKTKTWWVLVNNDQIDEFRHFLGGEEIYFEAKLIFKNPNKIVYNSNNIQLKFLGFIESRFV